MQDGSGEFLILIHLVYKVGHSLHQAPNLGALRLSVYIIHELLFGSRTEIETYWSDWEIDSLQIVIHVDLDTSHVTSNKLICLPLFNCKLVTIQVIFGLLNRISERMHKNVYFKCFRDI